MHSSTGQPEVGRRAHALTSPFAATIPDGFGGRLREERERLGLSQATLAAAGGVQRLAQSLYEKERSAPTIRYLAGISAVGIDLQYVLFAQDKSAHSLTPSEINRIELRAFDELEKFVSEHSEGYFDASQKFAMFQVFRANLTYEALKIPPHKETESP
ncbi:helix-turn-helix domain-containing protein [Burkholderia vietnamiensis]|uniref:helix-turn-helix domain-containing protein n=1 Tax=Burkholderia vietnamiensis TaxID=60552 RepID=UPI001ADB2CE6|nr:helix-turn-helix transcriptional regulator [Burkholderia vietnamiensis]QTK86453.1 helix-turn-helix transcriptional regulator [Burkholderia vietnamiensis]HDR9317250.1 helix-turn-helix transcriptional regulator [Burkholderia vietnamiensis]